MKKMLLLSICLLIGAWTLSAQQTLYIIDNETVESFDGSQLKGKTVRDYKITTQGSGRKAITVHAITTGPSSALSSTARISVHQDPSRKIVYVFDGKASENSDTFRSLSPEDIASISVYKENSPEAKTYGENVAVIQIQTKKLKNSLLEWLKGLPGVKVEADGSITLSGQPVKTITINGRSYSVNAQ